MTVGIIGPVIIMSSIWAAAVLTHIAYLKLLPSTKHITRARRSRRDTQ